MIRVADHTDCSAAVYMNLTQFAGRKTQKCVVAFFSNKLRRRTGRANELSAFTDFQFHVVYNRTERNTSQRQCIADFNIRFRTGYNDCTDCKTVGSNDIFLFAVCIVEQCDVSGAVRIVFDRSYFRRNIIFNSFKSIIR